GVTPPPRPTRNEPRRKHRRGSLRVAAGRRSVEADLVLAGCRLYGRGGNGDRHAGPATAAARQVRRVVARPVLGRAGGAGGLQDPTQDAENEQDREGDREEHGVAAAVVRSDGSERLWVTK